MHYLNILLDNLPLRDYKTKYSFLLFILEFLYTNTKFWHFESIFDFKSTIRFILALEKAAS